MASGNLVTRRKQLKMAKITTEKQTSAKIDEQHLIQICLPWLIHFFSALINLNRPILVLVMKFRLVQDLINAKVGLVN